MHPWKSTPVPCMNNRLRRHRFERSSSVKRRGKKKTTGLHVTCPRLLAILLTLLDLVRHDAIVFACTLVDLALVPGPLAFGLELVAACTELGNGLLRKQFLERPLLDILLLILLELGDELYCSL